MTFVFVGNVVGDKKLKLPTCVSFSMVTQCLIYLWSGYDTF